MNLPVYDSNNCYIDSVLVALFATESRVLDPYFFGASAQTNRLMVQQALWDITETMRYRRQPRPFTTSSLRRLLYSLYERPPLFTTETAADPKDAAEFLAYLLDIFPVPGTLVEIRRRVEYAPILVEGSARLFARTDFGARDSGDTVTRHENTAILAVNPASLAVNPAILGVNPATVAADRSRHAGDCLELVEALEEIGPVETFRTRDGDLRVRKPYRLLKKSVFDYATLPCFFLCPSGGTPVVPDKRILRHHNRFDLASVVCFQGGHYTCYYRRDKTWFHYSDLGDSPGLPANTEVGSYRHLIAHGHGEVSRCAVILVYPRVDPGCRAGPFLRFALPGRLEKVRRWCLEHGIVDGTRYRVNGECGAFRDVCNLENMRDARKYWKAGCLVLD